jgi:hypothetical protein
MPAPHVTLIAALCGLVSRWIVCWSVRQPLPPPKETKAVLGPRRAQGIVVTPCFEDWKRFCFVLREIARGGIDGRPLPGFEAQQRAQAILTERGYAWQSVGTGGSNKAPETKASLEEESADTVNGKLLQPPRRRSRR